MKHDISCRLCGRFVIPVRSAITGELIILDADAADDGTFYAVDGIAYKVGEPDYVGEFVRLPKRTSHFVTCSHADWVRNASARLRASARVQAKPDTHQ